MLAFNAGIALTTSSIDPVSMSDAFVVAFITSTVGLVLFNTMFALMTFVRKIVRKGAGRWSILSRKAFVAINAVIIVALTVFAVASYFTQ